MPFDLVTGRFIPEKTNIWRDNTDGYVDWVKEHIEEGATVNEADECGDPPLVLAAGNGHLACCQLLMEQPGINIEQTSVQGDTPLARAAHNGHLETVKYLVSMGAAIDTLDIGDNTPLHWAAMRGHVEIVKFLVSCGADKTRRNKQGKTPMDNCQPEWSHSWLFTRKALA